ncbi:MAG TPA: hypothetical protein VFU47_03110 [Armatimonadota bacterium]|nr:hypothetical protein [Armatimonadota bacterium]
MSSLILRTLTDAREQARHGNIAAGYAYLRSGRGLAARLTPGPERTELLAHWDRAIARFGEEFGPDPWETRPATAAAPEGRPVRPLREP